MNSGDQDAKPSVFTDAEIAYLHGERRLGRIASVGSDGTPHVVPVGWSHSTQHDTIDVTGRDLGQTKKFRDIARSSRPAIVIDDVASTNPWRPRGIEIRGGAEAILIPTRRGVRRGAFVASACRPAGQPSEGEGGGDGRGAGPTPAAIGLRADGGSSGATDE